MLYHFRGEGLDKKNIVQQFRKKRFPFATISKRFKMIEENTKTIIISREAPVDKILKEVREKGFTKKLMREAGLYCVNVHENYFKKMYAADALERVSEDMREDFFLLSEEEWYTEEMGLVMGVE